MLVSAFLTFLLSFLLVGGVRKYAPQMGLVDIPNARSIHTRAIPRGAGIGFFLSLFIVFTLFDFDLFMQYKWTMLAIFTVFVIGVLDDYKDTSPYTKFTVMLFGTLFLYIDGLYIDNLGVYFGMELSLGWLAFPFTVFAVSGFTNALNLIDGLDGLAALIAIVILGVFLSIGYQHGDRFLLILSLLTISALLGFLIFNWHPASVFMGDSGSLTIGFIISALAIKSLAYIPTVNILLIAAVPILDTLVVMIRRKRNGRSVFYADKCHIHHVLRAYFNGHTPRTVMLLAFVQGVYSILGIWIIQKADDAWVLILFLSNIMLLYFFLNMMIEKQKRKC